VRQGCSGGIGYGFVNQQNGNVVPDLIDPLAGAALQALSIVLQSERLFAGGADQNGKQVIGDHEVYFIQRRALIVGVDARSSLGFQRFHTAAIDFHMAGE
jgi:hypothetical protein